MRPSCIAPTSPGPAPSLRQGIAIVLVLGLATATAATLSGLLVGMPALFAIVLGLVLYLAFVLQRSGRSPAVGMLTLVVFSLLTSPEPAAKIDSFFTRLQTSSDGPAGGREALDAAGAHPLAAQPLLLVNLLRLREAAAGRGWRVFREDLAGFATAWVIVVVLVVGTAWFLAI